MSTIDQINECRRCTKYDKNGYQNAISGLITYCKYSSRTVGSGIELREAYRINEDIYVTIYLSSVGTLLLPGGP